MLTECFRENIIPSLPETEGVTFRKKLCWLLFVHAKRECSKTQNLSGLTWHASKYKVHKLHQKYILKKRHKTEPFLIQDQMWSFDLKTASEYKLPKYYKTE